MRWLSASWFTFVMNYRLAELPVLLQLNISADLVRLLPAENSWYIISIILTYLGPIWNYKFSHFLFTKASFLCFITLVVALGCLLECSWCWKSPDWIDKFFSLFKTNIIFAFLPKIPQSYMRITSPWAPCCKDKYACHIIWLI